MNFTIPKYDVLLLKKEIVRSIPICLSIICYLVILFNYVRDVARQTGLSFVYPLDDTYISMAVARNLAQYGIWGVDKYGFTSASSSLLWEFLSALVGYITNFWEGYPLLINVIFSFVIIAYIDRILKKIQLPIFWQASILLAIVLLVPLPAITFFGMETTIQVFLTLFFVDQIANSLSVKQSECKWQLLLTAFFMVACRYEGLFLIGTATLMYLIRRSYKNSVKILVSGILPVVAYGIYSCAHGSYFLPNTLILKGHINVFSSIQPMAEIFPERLHNWFDSWGYQLFFSTFSLGLLLLICDLLRKQVRPIVFAVLQMLLILDIFLMWSELFGFFHSSNGSIALIGMRLSAFIGLAIIAIVLTCDFAQEQRWTAPNVWAIMLMITVLIHMLVARFGWLYRYEAYLIAMGIVTLAVSWRAYFPQNIGVLARTKVELFRRIGVCFFLFFVGFQFIARAWFALTAPVKASLAVYEQQYQFAHFIKDYFPHSAIMLNDIGCASFYNDDIKIVDIMGLATIEALRARLAGHFDSNFVERLANNNDCKLIIIYDKWLNLHGGAPKNWIKVADWVNKEPTPYLGCNKVSFYSPTPKLGTYTLKCMQQFYLIPWVEKRILFRNTMSETDQ